MRYWPVLSLALLVTACAGDASQLGVTPEDSTAVRVVESSAPQWPNEDGWRIGESALLDLATSGTGRPHEFYRVTDALRLNDGRIIVADDGWLEVRFYSPSGEFIASQGGPGEGPGEFRRLHTISRWRGDSVLVFDQMLRRATVLSESGDVRTIPLGTPLHRPMYVRALGESGLVGLFIEPASRPTDPGVVRPPYLVFHLNGEGVVVDTLGQIPGPEQYWASGVDGQLLMGKSGHLAARGIDVVLGDSDSLAYERHQLGIGRTQEVRVHGFDLTLTAQKVEELRERLRDPRHPPDIRRFVETMPIPDSRPAYSKLMIDDLGCVWAASYRIPGEPEGPWDWQVFDSRGTWLGRVRMPDRFSPLDIAGESVLGVWRDPLDVQHVQIRSLTRSW